MRTRTYRITGMPDGMDRDRGYGKSVIEAMLPDAAYSATPRSTASALWRVSGGYVYMRTTARAVVMPEDADATPLDPWPVPVAGNVVHVAVDVQRSRNDPNRRGVRVEVPEVDMRPWAEALLRRNGMEPEAMLAEAVEVAVAERTLPAARLAAAVRITSPQRAGHAYNRGIGRGKAYGLGMVLPL